MDIKFEKNNLCVNRIVAQKTEKFMIEGDEIVPDIKPDILSVVSTNGNVCIYKKEVSDGKVKIEGAINAYVVYVADDEKSNIRAISTTLSFSKNIEMKELTSEMIVDEKSILQSLDCKILNGRKISLKAVIDISTVAYLKENVEYIKNLEDACDIETLSKELELNSLVGTGTTRVYAKDTLQIESTDNLADIMKAEISIENIENKVSYNKILSKADGVFKIMYLTDDGRIEMSKSIIPLIGFIDMQDVSDDDTCDISYELKNLVVKPNNVQEHSIYIEAEYELLGFVYKKQSISIIEDLYGRTKTFNYTQKSVSVMATKELVKDKYIMKKQEKIDGLANNKMYDVEVKPMILNSNIENGKINYQGNMILTCIYAQNESSSIGVKEIIEPFEFAVNSEQIKSKASIQTTIAILQKDIIITANDTVDIKLEMEFNLNICVEDTVKIIENINEEENSNVKRFSIVIYYTKAGDTLWNIAKKFGSTVEEIAKINNIEENSRIMQGNQLFIPR